MPPRTALVDFLAYNHLGQQEPQLLAFVLARDREPVLVPLGPSKPIAQAVEAWRKGIRSGPSDKTDEDAARELVRRVWEPLHKHLGDARAVLIAPDDALCGLSFAGLPGSRPGSYLIEELTIGYVTSGRHLLELDTINEHPTASGLLAVGDLSYDSRPAPPGDTALPAKPPWKHLPGTRPELERTAQVFRQAFPTEREPHLLTKAHADTVRLKQDLTPRADNPRWRYLHLATHGFFEPPPLQAVVPHQLSDDLLIFDQAQARRTFTRNPLLLSGLVLSGANRSVEQGILTAEEVADLDLRGCELAVLSACDTGLGRVDSGEGVLGLQRAFQAAGARTLVTSLWNVSDPATSLLMEEFYANLWQKKMGKLEALRQAQLYVLKNPDRVRQRGKELYAALKDRGISDEDLVARGIGNESAVVSGWRDEKPGTRRSPPALWAAWVLSGEFGDLPTAPEPVVPSPTTSEEPADPLPLAPEEMTPVSHWWTGWPLYTVAALMLGLLVGWIALRRIRRQTI